MYYEADKKRPLYVNTFNHGGYLASLLAILDYITRFKRNINGFVQFD